MSDINNSLGPGNNKVWPAPPYTLINQRLLWISVVMMVETLRLLYLRFELAILI